MPCLDANNSGCGKTLLAFMGIPHESGTDQYHQAFDSSSSFNFPSAYAQVIPNDGIISNLCVQVDSIPATGKTATGAIVINGITTALTATITDTGPNVMFNSTTKIVVFKGDLVGFVYNVDDGAFTNYLRLSAILSM